MSMYDRFSSREEAEWHEGAYWEGHRARCDGILPTECPMPSVVGEWYTKSWRAGWADADAGIALEETLWLETGEQNDIEQGIQEKDQQCM